MKVKKEVDWLNKYLIIKRAILYFANKCLNIDA